MHECFSASAVFSAKSNELKKNKARFALITHLLSIRATTLRKMLTNNEFKADTSTGNPTGNSRCYTLASRVLNMSCKFGQSARSIECRCVVIRPKCGSHEIFTTGSRWSADIYFLDCCDPLFKYVYTCIDIVMIVFRIKITDISDIWEEK